MSKIRLIQPGQTEPVDNNLVTNTEPKTEPIEIGTGQRFGRKSYVTTRQDTDISKYKDVVQNMFQETPQLNEIASNNQNWWQSTRNGFSQLLSGAVAEVVATPGYMMGAFEPIEEMDKGFSGLFLEAGNFIREAGQEFVPLYQSKASQDKVFAPWDSEWLAQTVADFGPTVALLTSSLVTEGITTPRLLNLLSKTPGVSKYATAAKALKQQSKFYNNLKTANATIMSRMAENGMEAHQTFKETYNKLKTDNPNLTDEEARKLAGEAGSQVWRKNWLLAAVDYFQFDGLLNGFGKLGKSSLLKQMGSEALEEGVQYTFQKEAQQDIDFKLGKTTEDLNDIEMFVNSLSDKEMQKAMVQGALGGAVFQGAGSIMKRVAERYAKPLNQSVPEAVKEIVDKGQEDVAIKDIETELSKAETTPEKKTYLESIKDSIIKYKEAQEVDTPYKAELGSTYVKAEQFARETQELDNQIQAKKSDKTIKNASQAVDFVEASVALDTIDQLRNQHSTNPLALKQLKRLEDKYKQQQEDFTSKTISAEAAPLVPTLKPLIKSKVTSEFNTEFQLGLSTELAKGKRDTYNSLIQDEQVNIIKKSDNVSELNNLQQTEGVLANEAKKRLNQLYKNESKVYPQNNTSTDWVNYYKENPATFLADSKREFNNPSLSLEEFESNFNQYSDQLQERIKNNEANQRTSVQKEEVKKPKEKIQELEEKTKNSINNKELADYSIATETLAGILEKRGHFDKAIKMYEKLSLKFPEKSSTFAAKIEKLNEIRISDINDIDKELVTLKNQQEEINTPVLEEHTKEEEPEAEPPLKEAKWASSNDMLFYRADEIDDQWYLFIDKKKYTLEEYQKLYDKPVLKNGYFPVLKNGEPVAWSQTDIDVEFTRKIYEITQKPPAQQEIFIQVDWGYVNGNWSNKKANADNFKIFYVIKHEGKDHIIGQVPALKGEAPPSPKAIITDYEDLKTFRHTLWSIAKQNSGIYEYPNTLSIDQVKANRVWNVKTRNSDLRSISNEKDINLAVFSGGKLYGLEQSSLDRLDKIDAESFTGYKNGNVYWFVTNPVTGKIFPIRLFTKRLRDTPKAETEVRNLLSKVNKDNWVDIRRKVMTYVKWGEPGNRQPDFGFTSTGKLVINGEIFDALPEQVADTIYDTLDMGDKIVQVDTDLINTKGYNEKLMQDGYIETNVNPFTHFHSPKFKIDYTQLKPIETKPLQGKQNMSELSLEEMERISNDIPDIAFKVASKNYTGKLWNKEEGQKWLKDKFGQEAIVLSQEEINDMADRLGYVAERGGQNLWGMFWNGSIYMMENAAQGTEIHEAGHLIFHSALSKTEQKALLQYGTEEEIMDAFAEYVITQKNPKKGLSRIFKKLYLFLKRILAVNKMTLDEWFWQFENSTYRNMKFSKNVDVFRTKKEDIHPVIVNRRVRLINQIFFKALDNLRKENPNLDNNDLFKLALGEENLYGTKVLDRIKEMRINIDNQYKAGLYDELLKGTNLTPERFYQERAYQAKQLEDKFYKDGKPSDWYYKALEDLRRYGIFVNTIGGKDTIENEEDGLELWMKENVKSPAFDSFTFELKKMLNNIPEAEFTTIKDKSKGNVIESFDYKGNPVYIKLIKDDFSQSIYSDGANVYSKLLEHLTNSLSQEDMMDKLKDISTEYAWAKLLYDELSTEANNYLDSDLKQLKAQMYNKFASWNYVRSIVITPSNDNELRLGYSNERSLKNNLIKDWWDLVDSPSNPLYQKEDDIKKTKEVISGLNYSNKSTKKDWDAITKTLNHIGIEVNNDIIEKIIVTELKGSKLKDAVLDIVGGNKSGVDALASLIKKYYPEYYQPSHISVDNEKVQNHIRASFMGRQIERFNRSEGMDIYEGDNFYQSIYKDTDQYLKHALWLDRFKSKKDLISFNLVDGFGGSRGIPFEKMTGDQFMQYQFASFYNNGNSTVQSDKQTGKAFYSVQLFSDSSSHALIGMESYTKEDILDKLVQVAYNEFYSIRDNMSEKLDVKNYKPEFDFFPFFNNKSFEDIDKLFDNRNEVKKQIETNINKWIESEKKVLESKDMLQVDIKGKPIFLDGRIKDIDAFLEHFYWNDIYAQTQIVSLFYGNLSFYKGTNDFYKRAKEIWAPGDYLDDSRINKKYFITVTEDIVVEDKDIISEIERVTNKEIANGYRVSKEKGDGLGKGSSLTDGQGIIDIYRWAEIEIGKGNSIEWVQGIVERVESGIETETDLEYIFNPYKPYMYDLIKVDGKVVPLQVKNSEYVLLPKMAENNPELKKVLDKLESIRQRTGLNGSLQFNSAIKVGEHKTSKDVNSISDHIELNNSEYRIQGEVPEHQIDTTNLLGTQLRKIATGDLDPEGDYTLPTGEVLKGSNIKSEFNNILKADVQNNAKNLEERFSDPNQFYKAIQEEAISRNYPKKIIDALEPVSNPDGTVTSKIPLYSPLLIKKAVALISSIYRNNITKLKFPGASLPNVSAFGLKRKPKIRFNKDKSINHLECYMPMTNSWLRDYMDKNGFLNVDKLAELGLDLGVAYRIPTEGKYSMVPIKVIGFVNSGIILPPEITSMTGLDFDIDKLYVMLYSFDIIGGKPVKTKWHTEANLDSYKAYIKDKANRESKDHVYKISQNERERIEEQVEEAWSKYFDFYKIKVDPQIREARARFRQNLKASTVGQQLDSLYNENKELISKLTKEQKQEFFDSINMLKEAKIYGVEKIEELLKLIIELKGESNSTPNQRRLDRISTNYEIMLYLKGIEKKQVDAFKLRVKEAFNKGLKEDSAKTFNKIRTSIWDEFNLKHYEILARFNNELSFSKFENNFDVYEHNSRRARDNRKLDIILSVLTNSHTVESQLGGGNFDRLEKLANELDPIKQELNPLLVSNRAIKFEDMMAGKALIGIGANYVATHQLMQGQNLMLTEPVRFNDNEASDLGAKYVVEYETIEKYKKEDIQVGKVYEILGYKREVYQIKNNRVYHRNPDLAEDEAASHIEPISNFLENLNQKRLINRIVTNELAQFNASFVDNGKNPLAAKYNMNIYTADVAMLITKLYGMETAMRFIAHPMVREFYQKYIQYGADFKAEDKVVKEYFPNMKFTGEKKTPPSIITNDMLVNKTNGDDVLQAFIYFKKNQAKELSDLVTAMKVPDNGMSSTIEGTLVSLDNVYKAAELKGITGVGEYFTNIDLHTTTMQEEGIDKPLDKMEDDYGFPKYREGAYQSLRDYFSDQKQSGKMTEDEMRFMHDVLMNYMSASFDYLKVEDKKGLVTKLPEVYTKAKNANVDARSKYKKFFGNIKLETSKQDPSLRILKLNGGITEDMENSIIEEWEMMIGDSNAIPETNTTYSKFATTMVKYAFTTKGFRFGPGSFSQVMPPNFYNELKDSKGVSFNQHIRNMIDMANGDGNSMENFKNQFVRNYFPRLNHVRTIDTEQDALVYNEDKQMIGVNASENFKRSDGFYADYVKFKDDKGKWHLFENTTGNKYAPVQPLGLYNEVEEFNPDVSYLNSKFNQPISNKVIEDSTKLEATDKVNTDVDYIPESSNFESGTQLSQQVSDVTDVNVNIDSGTFIVTTKNGMKEFKINYSKQGRRGSVPNETVANKVIVKTIAQHAPELFKQRTVEYNNSKYYIKFNNDIISINSSSAGKVVFESGSQRQQILDKLISKSTQQNQNQGSDEILPCF